MEELVQLHFKDVYDIVGGNGFSVIRMVDAAEQRALCLVCDQAMTAQLSIRTNNIPGHEWMLPEVLFKTLQELKGGDGYYIQVFDVRMGHYMVFLQNDDINVCNFLRISDAVLLHVIAGVPFYIQPWLMNTQSTPFQANNPAISIPINSLDTEILNRELAHAVETEDYRRAAILHEEIQKRMQS